MEINGKLNYRKALVLSPQKMRDLENLLLRYSNSIKYEVGLMNGTKISFDNIDELLSYDNYSKKRIKTMTIISYKALKRVFWIEFETLTWWFNIVGYWKTCSCDYTLDSTDSETVFRSEWKLLLQKMTANYWLFSEISLWGILFGSSAIVATYNCFTNNFNTSSEINFETFAIVMLIIIICATIDKFVIGKILPPLVFLWGEEEKIFEKKQAFRSNILWCVIVAIIVGLVTTVLANMIL